MLRHMYVVVESAAPGQAYPLGEAPEGRQNSARLAKTLNAQRATIPMHTRSLMNPHDPTQPRLRSPGKGGSQ